MKFKHNYCIVLLLLFSPSGCVQQNSSDDYDSRGPSEDDVIEDDYDSRGPSEEGVFQQFRAVEGEHPQEYKKCSLDEDGRPPRPRIILLGATGVGKSTFGNR